jgi:pyruvate,orthophosphate dikinase
VARQLNKVCLVGCHDLRIDLANRRCALGGEWLPEGAIICLDGNAGQVYVGTPQFVVEKPVAYLAEIARWRTLPPTMANAPGSIAR